MTTLLVLFVAVQAALLLWASIHLSNVFLHDAKVGAAAWTILMVGGALVISIYGRKTDLQMALCRPGDCAILLLSVACVRVIVVNKENDRLRLEREQMARTAAAAAEAEQRDRHAQRLVAAAAALDSRAIIDPESAPPSSRVDAPPSPRSVTRPFQLPARPKS